MKQSRAFSLFEALSNVAVGLLVALGTQLVVFHLLGIAVSTRQTLIITCAFTAVSILRSYALRRLFETLRVRWEHPWPPSRPCIRFDPCHQIGAGHPSGP